MTMSKEELLAEKKRLNEEIERQKLEQEVKELRRQTKKPGLVVGVLKAYVKMGRMAASGIGTMVDEINKPPQKKKGKGK